MKRFWTIWGHAAIGFLLAIGTATGVAAQGEDGFVPLREGESIGEQLPATPLVFAAYAAVWVLLLVYVYSLWRRVTRAERDLAEVTARLEARRP
jgi:CcmD family protein